MAGGLLPNPLRREDFPARNPTPPPLDLIDSGDQEPRTASAAESSTLPREDDREVQSE